MIKMTKVAQLNSGTPQFRIEESLIDSDPTYFFFGQTEMEDTLGEIEANTGSHKQIRTADEVSTTEVGDLIFSLISGKATIIRSSHSGYLLTQNYVKLITTSLVSKEYLAYTLNENTEIIRQLHKSQQGSIVLKYTISQLNNLQLPALPPLEKQRVIGELYFNQLRLTALKARAANLETIIMMERLKEADRS